MHPELIHAMLRLETRPAPGPRRAGEPRTPRTQRLRRAVGYRLVTLGWRLLDVSAAGAPPARTADPRPA